MNMEDRYEALCEIVARLADMHPWRIDHTLSCDRWETVCMFCGIKRSNVATHNPGCVWYEARRIMV